MHNFTRDTWTEQDTEAKRHRVTRISDDELLRELEASAYMCSPLASWGKPPRQSYLIQREIVRLEICRRGAALAGFTSGNF
jgi:hypothetical protein